MAPTTNKEQAMTTTTAQMTILYTEEIPTISHNHHDKPRRFPIIVKDGLWTAFVLSGPKGRRDTFGRLESIQRATFNDLEVALFADHGMIVGKVDHHAHNFVIENENQADDLKLRHPAHYKLSEFYLN
jgi:hypothetical protein